VSGCLGLALAHATRPGSKSLLVGSVAAIAAAALVAAFALGGAIAENTRRFLTERYLGDLVIAQGKEAAVFGNAVVTGNERQDTIVDFDRVEELAGVASSGPLVTGYLSIVAADEREERCIAFGIDAARAVVDDAGGLGFALEPGSRLPGAGEILVSGSLARRLGAGGTSPLRAGDVVTAAALKEAGLGLKPLRLSGVYAYDGGVAELDRIVYLDAATARPLLLDEGEASEGGISKPKPPIEVSEEILFDGKAMIAESASPARPAIGLALPAFPAPAPKAVPDARWHYLRLRLPSGAGVRETIASLNASFEAAGLGARALPWEAASSGYASSAGIVRAVLLGAIGLAAIFAILVLSNSLGLLAASRKRTIGTARALGATHGFVFGWIAAEGLMAAAAGAIAGAALAVLGLAALSGAAPPIDQPAFREVFASDRFVAFAGAGDAALAIAISIAAAAPAVLGASFRSLRSTPASAMRE
jgi:hypothetical protein